MTTKPITPKPITGRQVFFVMAGAFSIIVAVNLTLAFKAVSTFPGLEVKNSYVASQNFDRERTAQLALGWQVAAQIEGDRLILSIDDKDGPVENVAIDAIFGRATHVADDRTPVFTFDGSDWVAPMEIGPGNWNLRLVATAADGTPFRQRIPIYVKAQR